MKNSHKHQKIFCDYGPRFIVLSSI